MIFDKEGTITTIFQEKTSLPIFVQNINKEYPKLKHDHLIVNLFSFGNLSEDNILEFLELSNRHRNSGKSFVLVTGKVSYEEVPDEICLVPTLHEAKDLIEMEEIERDLGL
ncbi:MAG: ribonuclease Z [Bacteroidota bacterium]